MRRFFSLSLPTLTLGVAIVHATGCSSSSSSSGNSGENGDGGGGGDETPHALGAVVLGESHAPTGGASTPIVSAGFIPDSTALPKACSTQVGGCTFVTAPKCGTGCNNGDACAWDSSCNATCQPACTLDCGSGQECYFVSPGTAACRVKQSFDAGALAFAGTTTPITLFPPYTYDAMGMGAPFLAGAQIEVQASGASGAGFDKFDEKFTATSFLQTNPPINQITSATVFGEGSVPVAWNPGSDSITVTVTGAGGTVTCDAQDSTGSFAIPREAVNAAVGKGGGSALTLTVTRERDEWHKSESDHGTLVGETVQSTAWLELTTLSTETATFQGCQLTNETMCADGCFDLNTDPLHCGSCSTVCTGGQVCSAGKCTTGTATDCTTCESQADGSTCTTAYDSCEADTNCTSYASCDSGCSGNPTCLSNCQTQYPTGYSEYQNYKTCICSVACPSQCASQCANM
jgi:hypothetical protein